MTVVTDVHGILSVLRLGAQLNSSHSKRGGGGGWGVASLSAQINFRIYFYFYGICSL